MCVTLNNAERMPVKFYLESRPNKANEHPIRVSICIKSVKYISTIGYSVDAANWQNERVTGNKYTNKKNKSRIEINNAISKIESHFERYERDLDTKPTVAQLKEQLNIALGKSEEPEETPEEPKTRNVFEDFSEFVQEQSAACQWAYATLQCWKTFRNHLTAHNPKIKYEDFNEEGLNKFIAFLRTTQNLEEKTAQKNFSCLKWFLKWAIRKGYCTNTYINIYKAKFKILEKPVIFLTKEELMKLYNYKVPANGTEVTLHDNQGEEKKKTVHNSAALEKTRDLFCFCAFTSLRYSDMAKVKRSDIIGDYLYITTQKTNDRLPIDLNTFAKAILDKYKDEKFPDGLALPVISNQKMNDYLKDLCELCEFNEPITVVCYRAGKRAEDTYPKYELIGTHAGRRTFICFALSSGIPPQVVMKWTGHSDYKAMRPYIDIAEKTKANAMKLFETEMQK